MSRPFPLYPLVILHKLLGLGALYGGWYLLYDPTGLGVRPEWLAQSPFRSYLLPGLFLLLVQGVFPLFVVAGLWWKPDWRRAGALNIYPGRHWAWTYSLYTGLVLIGWITVQIMWVPRFWLQPVFLVVGLLILILTLWPGVMRYFENPNQDHPPP